MFFVQWLSRFFFSSSIYVHIYHPVSRQDTHTHARVHLVPVHIYNGKKGFLFYLLINIFFSCFVFLVCISLFLCYSNQQHICLFCSDAFFFFRKFSSFVCLFVCFFISNITEKNKENNREMILIRRI